MCQQGGANPIVLDAIVSNKTFRNATWMPNCLLQIPNFRAYKFGLSFEFFGRNGCSPQGNICDLQANPAQHRTCVMHFERE
jgi:hypothetical protein